MASPQLVHRQKTSIGAITAKRDCKRGHFNPSVKPFSHELQAGARHVGLLFALHAPALLMCLSS